MSEGAVPVKSLHGLAKENNVEEMIKLLTSRENVNARDKLKRTPLHLACYFGSLEAARLLIEYGANVNALAQDNVRPLGFAVMKNHMDIVRLLLSNGAASGINAQFQKNDVSCLHIAAKNGSKEMVQLLLDNGSNPNLRAKGNKLASDETTDKEIIKLLEDAREKWNAEKRRKNNERRRAKHGIEKTEESDEDHTKVVLPESKRAKTEEEKVIPKKLDLKKLAFMLDEDDELCVCSIIRFH
ncbi:hypothetical protein WA538_006094 [Blastocystis sp. DL]